MNDFLILIISIALVFLITPLFTKHKPTIKAEFHNTDIARSLKGRV